jgi:hypothetical protein
MSTTSHPAPPSFPAGWYDVPDRANTKGYWDGERWTGDFAPAAEPAPAAAATAATEPESAGGIVIVGYVTAALIPLIGFILGIVVATRPAKATSKHGAWIIVVSIFAFIVWIAIIVHNAQTASTTSY